MTSKCEQLAGVMFESVYPRLIEVMKHLNLKETVVIAVGSKKILFNVDGSIKWVETNGTTACREDYSKSKFTCPAMKIYKDVKQYVTYCNAMMDKIVELEKEMICIEEAIERASKIGVTYERKVITEK